MSSIIKIGGFDYTLDPGPFRVTGVQLSGSMPGGHGSASFEVPVGNAYLAPYHALREGVWIEIYDDAHELYEGEIFSVKPVIDIGGQHKLSVVCGGLISVAGKRADVSATWVHRGSEGWIRRPGTPSNLGNVSFDNGKVDLRVSLGSTQNYIGGGVSSVIGALFYLDSGLSTDTINHVDFAGSYDVTTEAAVWYWKFWTNPSLSEATWTMTALTASAGANATWSDHLTPDIGTKVILLQLVCLSGAHTVTREEYVTLTTMDIFGMNRTSKARIDEAMVQLAVRPGLAVSSTSEPIGPAQDDLRLGNGLAKVTTAAALTTLASLHSQPFEYAFWDKRSFDIAQMPDTPADPHKVIVVGGGNPGLESWEVAEYDEDVAQYACVLFGNTTDTNLPEGWPRRIYRPSTPPDDAAVKLDIIDFSNLILSDAAAATLGGDLLGASSTGMPDGQVFDAHPGFANAGLTPGNNTDPTSIYRDHYNSAINGTLSNFGGTTVTGGTKTTDGAYTVHTFTTLGISSLVITPGASLSAEYLVVAGGGGGGLGTSFGGGGGGGGGEVLTGTVTLSGTSTVIVGAGGIAGGTGGGSFLGTVIARGGSPGLNSQNYMSPPNTAKGGAGGASGTTNAGGAGGRVVFNSGGGGGGGATAVGAAGDYNVGGNGGAGISSSISGAPVGYGGGGGGGVTSFAGTVGGTATSGGGRGSANDGTSVAGTANTGGGGGGTSPKAGGSGVVIVRYLTASLAGGYNIYSGWAGSNSVLDPSALVGDGSNDYVSFGDVAACDFGTGAFSVRAWVKVSSAPTYAAVVSKFDHTSDVGWVLGVDTTRKVYGAVYGSAVNSRQQTGATVLTVGQWYHLVMTYSGSGGDIQLFVNSIPETMTALGTVGAWNTSNTANLQLFTDSGGYYFNGALGRATVWGYGITGDGVLSDMAATSEYAGHSLSKGTVVITGTVKNRLGTPVPAKHVRAGWWIQNLGWQTDPAKPPDTLYITGHSVDLAAGKNALTIGQDWMEKEIGVRQAELLAIPATDQTVPDAESMPDVTPYEPTDSTTTSPPSLGGQTQFTGGGTVVSGMQAPAGYQWVDAGEARISNPDGSWGAWLDQGLVLRAIGQPWSR